MASGTATLCLDIYGAGESRVGPGVPPGPVGDLRRER